MDNGGNTTKGVLHPMLRSTDSLLRCAPSVSMGNGGGGMGGGGKPGSSFVGSGSNMGSSTVSGSSLLDGYSMPLATLQAAQHQLQVTL